MVALEVLVMLLEILVEVEVEREVKLRMVQWVELAGLQRVMEEVEEVLVVGHHLLLGKLVRQQLAEMEEMVLRAPEAERVELVAELLELLELVVVEPPDMQVLFLGRMEEREVSGPMLEPVEEVEDKEITTLSLPIKVSEEMVLGPVVEELEV